MRVCDHPAVWEIVLGGALKTANAAFAPALAEELREELELPSGEGSPLARVGAKSAVLLNRRILNIDGLDLARGSFDEAVPGYRDIWRVTEAFPAGESISVRCGNNVEADIVTDYRNRCCFPGLSSLGRIPEDAVRFLTGTPPETSGDFIPHSGKCVNFPDSLRNRYPCLNGTKALSVLKVTQSDILLRHPDEPRFNYVLPLLSFIKQELAYQYALHDTRLRLGAPVSFAFQVTVPVEGCRLQYLATERGLASIRRELSELFYCDEKFGHLGLVVVVAPFEVNARDGLVSKAYWLCGNDRKDRMMCDFRTLAEVKLDSRSLPDNRWVIAASLRGDVRKLIHLERTICNASFGLAVDQESPVP